MKKLFFVILILLCGIPHSAFPIKPENHDLRIIVIPGKGWLHSYNLFIKNAPTYAIWLETEEGKYINSVFVTQKIASEGWIFNKGKRRIESLPVWAHKRNIAAPDGLLLPTRSQPIADDVSGATPSSVQTINLSGASGLRRFRIVCEVNHSTDFNEYWPKNALRGKPDWTGGKDGSGQPSVVYSALIDLANPGPWKLEIEGHGSPDGSDGDIYHNLASLTSALTIIEQIQVEKH